MGGAIKNHFGIMIMYFSPVVTGDCSKEEVLAIKGGLKPFVSHFHGLVLEEGESWNVFS